MNTTVFLIVFGIILVGAIVISNLVLNHVEKQKQQVYDELVDELHRLFINAVKEGTNIDELEKQLSLLKEDTDELKSRVSSVSAKLNKLLKGE